MAEHNDGEPMPVQGPPDSTTLPTPAKRLPQPEDFTDPALAEAVRAMHAALQATGWRPE